MQFIFVLGQVSYKKNVQHTRCTDTASRNKKIYLVYTCRLKRFIYKDNETKTTAGKSVFKT